MFAKGSFQIILIPFILIVLTLFLNLFFFNFFFIWFLFCLFIFFGILFLVFFRDPKRTINNGIVAVADGKITEIKDFEDYVKIIIFMNAHNVHVNRMPIDGKIIEIKHVLGKHIPAFFKDSERNERVNIKIECELGIIKIVQIAGIVARRIVPYIKEGDFLKKGERIGIIKFGSRVDLYLPKNKVEMCVIKGDKVKAGETRIANLLSN